MQHPDSKGYYRIIGLAPHAADVALAKAYRRRRKELAARAGRMGGELQLRELEAAWAVLSDPEKRAAYDMEALIEATGGAAGPDAGGDPVACARCNTVTAQPRYLAFHRVAGGVTRVAHERLVGVYCPSCARDVSVGASLLTWLIGWWGFPDGPVASVKAIVANARGGDFPRRENARLLAWQAHSFARMDKRELARAVAREALELDPRGPHAPALERLLGDGEAPLLKDHWRMMRSGTVLQLFPLVLLAVVVAWTVTKWMH